MISKIRVFYNPICYILVVFTIFVVISDGTLALSNYGVNTDPDIDQVLISSFELPLQSWFDEGEFLFERKGVSVFMEDKFASGFIINFKELNNRDVFVSLELSSDFIDIYSVGTLASENGVPLYWTLGNNSAFLNITLTARADETFRMTAMSAFKYKIDYGYRAKFRALNGRSVRLDVRCDSTTPNVAVTIEKNFIYYNDYLEIKGNSVMVKYRVAHGFKYPINENRNNPIWYEVRDIDSNYIQVVVHFTNGISGDVFIFLNPVWYDYTSWVGMLDAFGWDEPIASLGVAE